LKLFLLSITIFSIFKEKIEKDFHCYQGYKRPAKYILFPFLKKISLSLSAIKITISIKITQHKLIPKPTVNGNHGKNKQK